MNLQELFDITKKHQKEHECGGHPYQFGEVLTALIAATRPTRALEIGTAYGYTTACIAYGTDNVFVETIDQDATHLEQARKFWDMLGLSHKIDDFEGKAEEIMPNLKNHYDFIFFDGYTPQLKFLPYFEKLLNKGGLLVTANLFLGDPNGGRFLSHLKNSNVWRTGVFEDTAISAKLL